VYTVVLRRPGAEVRVLWDQHPEPATASLTISDRTQAFDKFGQRLPLKSKTGIARISLAGASGNTDSANPKDYVIGGNPIILVTPTA
jgi:hypothetical protein